MSLVVQPEGDSPLVSMVDGELFDKLDKIGSKLKGNYDEPFGGIQVDMGCWCPLMFLRLSTVM